MRKYISNGKVDSMASVGIDKLYITDPDVTFHREQSVNVEAKIIMTDYKNVSYAYNIKSENVSITNIKSYELNGDAERITEMCTMYIPYNTVIVVSEIEDSEEEVRKWNSFNAQNVTVK